MSPETSRQAENKETAEALEQLPGQLAEICEHLSNYLDAKWSQGKGGLQSGLLAAALWILLIFLSTGVFLIAISFVVYGGALALSEALGGRLWAGFLISGGVLLLSGTLFIRWKLKAWRRASLQKKIQEYERQLERQKEKYGFSAMERATAAD